MYVEQTFRRTVHPAKLNKGKSEHDRQILYSTEAREVYIASQHATTVAMLLRRRGEVILFRDSLKTFIGRTQERLCTNSLNVTNLKMLISNLKRRGLRKDNGDGVATTGDERVVNGVVSREERRGEETFVRLLSEGTEGGGRW